MRKAAVQKRREENSAKPDQVTRNNSQRQQRAMRGNGREKREPHYHDCSAEYYCLRLEGIAHAVRFTRHGIRGSRHWTLLEISSRRFTLELNALLLRLHRRLLQRNLRHPSRSSTQVESMPTICSS